MATTQNIDYYQDIMTLKPLWETSDHVRVISDSQTLMRKM